MKRLFFIFPIILALIATLSLPAMIAHADDPIIGEVRMFAAGHYTPPPDGFLDCNGDAISRTQYAALFDVISTTYGNGDGSTTFNVPDFQGKFPLGTLGYGEMCQCDPRCYACEDPGDTGGEIDHTLTITETPNHSHELGYAFRMGAGSNYVVEPWFNTGTYWSGLQGTGSSGGDQPHNNMPPFLAIRFIIAYTTTVAATPTPTPTPTSTPIITGASYLPYISAYTYTLDSEKTLVVPVYYTYGDIIIGGLIILVIVAFSLIVLNGLFIK